MVIKIKNEQNETAKRTLRHVWYGIWIICVIVIAIGVWFCKNKISFIIGEVTGSLIATLLMLHMYHCIDKELDMPEAKAVMHSRVNGIIRISVEVVAVVGCFYISAWINPFALLAGLFGRKLAAIMVPYVFERERNGQMLPEDKEQMMKYGRLLSKSELEELEEKSDEVKNDSKEITKEDFEVIK
ncbi:MAG: ATP synthase subunit I [Eubacterium sp.]|nr:ATP synthase subunit I [Eubacterium sp.]